MPCKIAVLLPVYNSQKYLSLQMSSILFQQNVDIQLYIYDDFSDDNSLAIINEFADKYFNIEVVPRPDCGRLGRASASFFYLIEYFSEIPAALGYDYVALSDHDDIWMPFKLSSLISEMRIARCGLSSAEVLCLPYFSAFGIGNPFFTNKSSQQRKYDYLFQGPGPGCTFVFKKLFFDDLCCYIATIKNTPDFRNVFWHDWFIYAFFRSRGCKWLISAHSHMLYIQHGGNETGANHSMVSRFHRLRLLMSNYYYHQVLLIINMFAKNLALSRHLKARSPFPLLLWLVSNWRELRRLPYDSIIMAVVLFKGSIFGK